MKKHISVLMAAVLTAAIGLGGCSGSGSQTTAAQNTTKAETTTASEETTGAQAETTATEVTAEAADQASEAAPSEDPNAIRVGSLKGPTSMGLVQLMDLASKGETEHSYQFTMAGKADELVGKIANGDLDIALVPANVASVLYNKTQGTVTVLDVNTLGVLYVVASDDTISSMSDLKGRTVYMTGKGTTPEYVMNYLLSKNGLTASDVNLQFKSEATEVASILKEDPEAIGVLPQPFATAACIQNEALKTVLDLTEQWNMLNDDSGSMMVTGVTLVRDQFLEENSQAAAAFLEDHRASAAYTASHPDEAAELIASLGIVEKAPIAKKALPYCNIVCLTGQEMKDALSGYLSVLAEQDMKSIGGAMPGDDFYYMP